MTSASNVAAIRPAFKPSRLGHANIFVGDVEKSIRFYNDIAGVELVRREPEIFIAFHSNGNTHHDVGLVQVKDSGPRLGIDGFVQVSSYRGSKPGLNHFGWEMLSEVELLAALKRAKQAGHAIVAPANHQLSHAAYIVDPDGNYHEFYADSVERWREIFNLDHEELVSEAWDWEKSGPGLGPMPADPSDKRRVDSAVFHPRRITHATLAVSRFDDVAKFLEEVGGFERVSAGDGVAVYRGVRSVSDLVLVDERHVGRKGLHSIAFVVEDEADLLESRKAVAARGIPVVASLDLPHKRNVVVTDPDGLNVEFYWRRPDAKPVLPKPGSAGWIYGV
jgi:catechol 2,3-dioxygenase